MRKIFITILTLIIFSNTYSQKKEDSKIIVTVTDTAELYKRVKIALVNSDFIVKDNYNKDTVTTYAMEMKTLKGYAIVRAIIAGNNVTLSGVYGLIKINDWGYTETPKNYQPMIYYQGSKTWKLLKQVAEKLGGQITFLK
ncbi:MAG: hypothetical protein WAU23_09240 [Ferruginibacter sp.]